VPAGTARLCARFIDRLLSGLKKQEDAEKEAEEVEALVVAYIRQSLGHWEDVTSQLRFCVRQAAATRRENGG
jgi:hypothetical protein